MPEIIYFDTETRSLLDVTKVGAHKYAYHPSSRVTVLCHAPDDDWPRIWSPAWAWGNSEHSTPDEDPTEFLDHIEDGGYLVAWNAAFDRLMWNTEARHHDWPEIQIDQILCAQAQAEANNLPGKLGKAAECLGTYHKKDPKGAKLIAQLSNGDIDTWDSETFETPELMGHFRAYCMHDVTSTREIFQATRPLMEWEWKEYHASERINDRGVMVDWEFAREAQKYARAEQASIDEDLIVVTGDERITINNHLRKARWLWEQLFQDEDLQKIVERPPNKSSPDIPRFSADRPTREAVLEALANPDRASNIDDVHRDRVIRFLELIEAGNSAAVRKFTAIYNQAHEGRVYGSYSFNGAGQTGRFSSRGIQVHNIIRAPLDYENPDRALDAIDDIMDGAPAHYLVDEYGLPMSRLLARLIRPTFIASDGNMLVWADWDQIEARVLPWLANTPGAEAKLDLFRGGEDVYRHAASAIFRKWFEDIDDQERQVGKVSELALGFGGAGGAFNAMARGYGITVPANQVRQIVDNWRTNNQWCVAFWHELWRAALHAYKDPGTWYHAGRVRYLFHPGLMHGTLICELPDGRWLVYPQFKHERVVIEDEDGNTEIKWRTTCVKSFGGGFGRSELWYGILAENITQAVAASFLRRSLVFEQDYAVLHTHDEIVLEVPEHQVEDFAVGMQVVMTDLPEWAKGLPLTVSIESGPFYTK